MWYVLMENSVEYYKEHRLLFGAEIEAVAKKLMQFCDVAMQFDLEEMSMDDIDGYYTEGYDDYEALEEAPSEALIRNFRFQCNDAEIRVLSLTETYEDFQLEYSRLAPGRLRNFVPIDGLEGDERMLKKLDEELKALSDGQTPEKMECFVER